MTMQAARILVVDDDQNIRTMVRTCLEKAGYNVELAVHGADALEFIHRAWVDLVLLDLAMPIMDGMTALAEIRALFERKRPRVVVMTAHGSVKTAIEALRLGASDFLEKPFMPDDLRQSVASVLHADSLKHVVPAGGGYGEVLDRVRNALRAGEFREAEKNLMTAGLITDEDPAFLNLAGLLHESHGRMDSAWKFYQKATAKSPAYVPAQENLKRLNEIRRGGRSRRPVAFGDDKAATEENWKANS
jgi:DNA-binding response OmpR family regulator